MRTRRTHLGLILLLSFLGLSTAAGQENGLAVDLQLVLLVDVSASMDQGEFLLQRSGYAAAIEHPDVIRAIGTGRHGRIAVTYVEWSSPPSQNVIVPWRVIDGAQSAHAFADALAAKPIASAQRTSISAALTFGAHLLESNGFDSPRRTIDISGDGPNNSGPPVAMARDKAAAAGIVINGLPILVRPSPLFPAMDRYYRDCVITGPGSFVLPVYEMEEFAEAIRRKLILEIVERPTARIIRAQAVEPVDCLIGEKMRDKYAPFEPD